MQPLHKMGAAVVALSTLINLPAADAGRISICPPNYGQVEWNNCLGVYYFPDGTKYVGEFQKDKFHGRGLIVWNHKSACLGIFNRGKLEGKCLIHKPKRRKDRPNANRNFFARGI
jgi:hypothetical protein